MKAALQPPQKSNSFNITSKPKEELCNKSETFTDATVLNTAGPSFDFSNIPLYQPPAYVQTKLTVNSPGDEYEREADAVADKVMRMTNSDIPQTKRASSNNLHRKCTSCEKKEDEEGNSGQQIAVQKKCNKCEEEDKLQRKTDASFEIPPIVDEVLNSPGQPLDSDTRAFMEPRFGHDFGNVRVHTDASAADSARAVSALAYTVGHNVVFGENKYAPGNRAGRELLAHELAHTIQQRGACAKAPPIARSSALETQAEQAGRDAAAGNAVVGSLGTSGLAVARAPDRPSYLDSYNDEQLEDQARMYRVSLRRRPPDYLGREDDVKFLNELTTEIERRAVAAEAQGVLEHLGEKLEGEAPELAVTSMALPTGRRGAKPAPIRAVRKQKTTLPSKFEPGGFTNEDIEREWKESEERIEKESKPKEQPFIDRFYAARRHAPLGDNDRSVWDVGKSEGLFTEDDRWAFDRLWEERIGKPAHKEAKQNATVANIQRERAWEAHGDAMRSHEMIIQPFVVAAAAPELVAAAYFRVQTGEMVVDLYDACANGTAADCVAASAQIAAVVALHRVTGGKPGEAPEGANPPMPEDPKSPLTPVTGAEPAPQPKVTPRPEPQIAKGKAPVNENAILSDIEKARQKRGTPPRWQTQVAQKPLAATGTDDVAPAKVVEPGGTQQPIAASGDGGATNRTQAVRRIVPSPPPKPPAPPVPSRRANNPNNPMQEKTVKPTEPPEGTQSVRSATPGQNPEPRSAAVGNFAEKNFNDLPGMLRRYKINSKQPISKPIPPGAKKYQIQGWQGTKPGARSLEIDALDRGAGDVIEIKPHNLYDQGLAEAEGYASIMDDVEPLPPEKLPNGDTVPRLWKPKCRTYDGEAVGQLYDYLFPPQ